MLSLFVILFIAVIYVRVYFFFFFSSRRRHTRLQGDWSSDVCSSDLTSTDSMGDAVAVLMLACLLGWPNKNCGVTVGGRSYMPLTETPLGASTWGFPAVPGCHWQWPVSPLKSRARFPRPLSPPIHAPTQDKRDRPPWPASKTPIEPPAPPCVPCLP